MYFDETGKEIESIYSLPPGSFYKNKKTDIIWWVVKDIDVIEDGEYFSFDKVHIYNTYQDYHRLPKSDREIFDEENPYLAVHLNGSENVSEKVREAYKEEMGCYPGE